MPDDDPFRQFYEQGGYVGKTAPRKRLNMALWGSQYMATGGSVPPNEPAPMPKLNLAYGSQYFRQGGSVNKMVDAMIALHRACGGRID